MASRQGSTAITFDSPLGGRLDLPRQYTLDGPQERYTHIRAGTRPPVDPMPKGQVPGGAPTIDAQAEAQGLQDLTPSAKELMMLCKITPPGCVRRLKELLGSGAAHPWSHRADGNTALHLAAESGRPEMVHVLLAAGANAGYQNVKGQTPLHNAVVAQDITITQALIAYCTYDGVLQVNRLDLDVQDLLGCSALHYAQHVGCAAAVRILVDAGASVTLADKAGRTPLHWATDADAATVLLKVDRELVKLSDDKGMRPAHYAAMRNSFPLLSQFCRLLGATEPDLLGMTPLHICIQHGAGFDVINRLCTSCAIHAADLWKLTALDYALQLKKMNVVELMVKNGARVDHVRLLQTRRYRLERDEQRFSGAIMDDDEAIAQNEAIDVMSTCVELLQKHEAVLKELREEKDGLATRQRPAGLKNPGPTVLELNAKTMAKYEAALQAGGGQQRCIVGQSQAGAPSTSEFTLQSILKRSEVAGSCMGSGDLRSDVRMPWQHPACSTLHRQCVLGMRLRCLPDHDMTSDDQPNSVMDLCSDQEVRCLQTPRSARVESTQARV